MEQAQAPISERIKSLRDTVGASYTLPNPERVEELINALWSNESALDYLRIERNLTEETIKHFKLGFDTSTNAISIPIYKKDVLVNIKYRLLDNPDQRYSGEANAEPWVFNDVGLEEGKRKGAVLVVEGEIDAMSAWQVGIKHVISSSSGKEGYGSWLGHLDNIPRIYIAYDSDKPGREASQKLAERMGTERCFDINYPDAKDANEYLKKHTADEFRAILKGAKPFIREQFNTLVDVVQKLRAGNHNIVESQFIPSVKFQKGWMGIISGRTNVGKTSYVMNIANELATKRTGVLIMPFERGIESVGERFLHVRYKSSPQDFSLKNESEWDSIIHDVVDLPVYFAMPSKEEVVEFIVKSKRYFNTEVVIIDHLDYLVRQVSANRGDAIADTLQQLKKVAEDNGVVLLIVSHVRKTERAGEYIPRGRRPNIEDLKGSSSLYQDPEVVVMLSENESEYEMYVDVLKNKGSMEGKSYLFDRATGVYTDNAF